MRVSEGSKRSIRSLPKRLVLLVPEKGTTSVDEDMDRLMVRGGAAIDYHTEDLEWTHGLSRLVVLRALTLDPGRFSVGAERTKPQCIVP